MIVYTINYKICYTAFIMNEYGTEPDRYFCLHSRQPYSAAFTRVAIRTAQCWVSVIALVMCKLATKVIGNSNSKSPPNISLSVNVMPISVILDSRLCENLYSMVMPSQCAKNNNNKNLPPYFSFSSFLFFFFFFSSFFFIFLYFLLKYE